MLRFNRRELDMSEQGYSLSDASRFSHSLDALHYNYVNAAGNKDMIKIEINYSLTLISQKTELIVLIMFPRASFFPFIRPWFAGF